MKVLPTLLKAIVQDHTLHAKWLNTLSYLENCGARKLAACEHPTKVRKEMLQHAAEEFRHAHYLKEQIARVTSKSYPDYRLESLLGGFATLHYLNALDVFISRMLKKQLHLKGTELVKHGYLLVTYAIEIRANSLYAEYESILREHNSKVKVRSILIEEEHHLQEIVQELSTLENPEKLKTWVIALEAPLFSRWRKALNAF